MAMFQNEQNAPPQGPPTDLVLRMRGQGYSNNQIVQTLQREGYKSHDIFDAMNQADIKGSVRPVAQQDLSEMPQPDRPMQINQPPMESPHQEAPPTFGNAGHAGYEDKERIEEISETIISEKWEDLVKDIKKVADWKERTESKITQMEQQFKDLQENFKQLHSGVIGKIGEYDESLSNVGTEIKALEKVFQKILPTLTENVNELSRITKDIKKK